MASAGKYAYGSKRVENMQTVLSTDGYATSSSAKSGKVCHWSMCEANMQPMLSAGKYAIGAKCGYICNQY